MKHIASLRGVAVAVLGGWVGLTSLAQAEGVLAQLYAARPPAGTAFVRIVNPATSALRVKIAAGAEQTLSGDKIASTYAIVKGDTPFSIHINGKAAASMQMKPDTFTTLVPQMDGKAVRWVEIDDSGNNQDALKAELRFYNLGNGCAAGSLQVAPTGPQLFGNVQPQGVASRSINPVKAQVQTSCGSASSAPLTLPSLQPGDHYSLFLTGTGSAPVLRGQVSATDPYKP